MKEQKFIICDLDGCTIDDSHRLNLIKTGGDFSEYHDAMVSDEKSLPVGKLFIEYALENDINIIFFTLRPETHRQKTIAALKRIYSLDRYQYTLVMRKATDKRRSVEIKKEMLGNQMSIVLDNVIAAIDDHYDIVNMYREHGIPSFVVNDHQLIDSGSPLFTTLFNDGEYTFKGRNYAVTKGFDILISPSTNIGHFVAKKLEEIYGLKNKQKLKIVRPVAPGFAHEIGFDPAKPGSERSEKWTNNPQFNFLPAEDNEQFDGTQDGARGNANGRKFDADKLRFSLLPVDSLEEVVKVLEFGAKKYAEGNWKKVDNADKRYYDAALRHILLGSGSGESDDPETGLKHTAHAICCLLFKLHFELEQNKHGTGND